MTTKITIGEANRVRACLDCGEPGASLWRTTKGENTGRLLRVCDACLRKDDWHVFGLVERQPILGEERDELRAELAGGEVVGDRQRERAKSAERTLETVTHDRDQALAENDRLRAVAEAFRVWTLAKPNTVEESNALTQACDALSAYDVERVKRGAR